jgi:hypothetical protein
MDPDQFVRGTDPYQKCQGSLTLEWVLVPNTGVGTGTRYLGAGGEEEAAHAAGLAHAPRGDGRQHVLHRVIDGQARCHTATRRVYVPRHRQFVSFQTLTAFFSKK